MRQLFKGSILLIGLIHSVSHGQEIRVVESKRNIQLSENEPVFRDFYLNAGTGSGLKTNLVVKVVRKVNVRDATGTQSLGEMQLPVGQLRILWAQDNLSIAREYNAGDFAKDPVVENQGVMVGDRIDLKGSFVDNKKSSVKRSTASLKEAAEVALVTTAAANAAPSTQQGLNFESKKDSGPQEQSAKEKVAPKGKEIGLNGEASQEKSAQNQKSFAEKNDSLEKGQQNQAELPKENRVSQAELTPAG